MFTASEQYRRRSGQGKFELSATKALPFESVLSRKAIEDAAGEITPEQPWITNSGPKLARPNTSGPCQRFYKKILYMRMHNVFLYVT